MKNEEVENGDNENGGMENEYMEGRITSEGLIIEEEGTGAANSQEAGDDEEVENDMNQEEAQMDEEEEQKMEKPLEPTTLVEEEGKEATAPQDVANETSGGNTDTQSVRRSSSCTFAFVEFSFTI